MSLFSILKRINLILSFTVVFIAIFIAGYPLIPEIHYRAQAAGILDSPEINFIQNNEISDLSERKIIFPKINVENEIIRSNDKEALEIGFWNRPNSSTPDKGGNTVIAGHRFQYLSGPQTLYHLDKVDIGDNFQVIWDGEIYNYEVFNIFEVTPDQVEIEENTAKNIVTLYTCSPLYSASKRLVVRGELTNE